jgi:hypothetical protein
MSRKKESSEKALRNIILSFLRKQESSIFTAFLDSRFRGSGIKAGFSEISK